MKSEKIVFISFNQVLEREVLEQLKSLSLRGYTQWSEICGSGSNTGDPHLGTHAWPVRNGALLVVCPEEKAYKLLDLLEKLDKRNPNQGLRAFLWASECSI